MPPRRARTRARRKGKNAVLQKVKPSLVPVPVEISQDSLVPDACLPTTPPKKKEALSFSPLSLPAKKGRRPLDPPPSPGKAKRPAPQLVAARAVGSPQATPNTRKRRSLYEFRPEEFVEVVSPVKKQRILTEHQREVRKERRSLPALYSNLSQSNLESQDSEETPQSEDMDATEPTLNVPEETKPNGFPTPTEQPGDGTLSEPVIILDSDEGEENEPLSSAASLLPGREACRTPPLQELLPENTAGDAAAMSTTVVPETQQDDTPCAAAATPLLETPKARQQEHGSPPSAGAANRPPRWAAGSPAALSRSRIMVDAAMRNVGGLSPSSRHSPSNGHIRQAADGGRPVSILKRPPPPGSSSPQQPKQSGRHVSFADPPVQGECEIKECKRRFSRALYEEPELDEGELVDSQLAVWPALEASTDPISVILPFLASSLWQRSLGNRLRQRGLCTVGSLASLTAAQALQLPLRPPRVASLRTALQQYADSIEGHGGEGDQEESPLPSPAAAASAFSSKQALPPVVAAAVEESCNGLATPEVALCDIDDMSSQEEEEEEEGEGACAPPAADATAPEAIGISSSAATPSLDLEEDEALPCGQQQQATCQEGDVPEESAAVVAEEIAVAAALVSPSSSCDAASQTAEPRTLCSSAVQCKASTTVVGSQTGPVVLSKQEVCQLLTPDFFASLEKADLGQILATIATVVAADHRTTGFV